MEAASGVLSNLLALPQGAGAPSGMGERFQPDFFKGTGSYAIPIAVPEGPNKLRPQLALRYATGSGNGPFGIGWQFTGALYIQRRVDRGAPGYEDGDELQLAGADLLVPVGDGRYRPRTERAFLDIRRHDDGWRIRTKEGRATFLGETAASRLAHRGRVLAWYAEREIDPAGNEIRWIYEEDGGYLLPRRISWSVFSVELHYEDRPDVSSEGRAGFARTLTRRCRAIERRREGLTQPVLSRYDLVYRQDPITGASLLAGLELTGFGADGSTERGAPLAFDYSQFEPRATQRRLRTNGAPRRSATAALADLDGDGRPEIVETRLGRHRVWTNLGAGEFGPARTLGVAPAGLTVGRAGTTFVDLDGDGAIDLLRIAPGKLHAYRNAGNGGWDARPTVVRTTTAFNPSAPSVQFADLDGDGATDVFAGRGLVARARADIGWERLRPLRGEPTDPPPADLHRQEIRLADLTGDGLIDIVELHSGRVEYWPSLGNATYGRRIRMRNAPLFPARADPRRVFLVDINRDGLADLCCVDEGGATLWFNRQGIEWSEPHRLRFAGPRRGERIELVDLLGNGVVGVFWADQFVELGVGRSHMLTEIDHGTGARSLIEYRTHESGRTSMDTSGSPRGHLPFPLHVVARITRTDVLAGTVSETSIEYELPAYDGIEREFRGFAHVEVTTRTGPSVAPTLQMIDFETGATSPGEIRFLSPSERAEQRARSGSVRSSVTCEIRPDGALQPLETARNTWITREEVPGVLSMLLRQMEYRSHAPGQRDRIVTTGYEYDRFGNVTLRRERRGFEGDAPSERLQRVTFVERESEWLVGLPARIESLDGAGTLLADTRHFYDGPAFVGEPADHATRGLLRRTEELAFLRTATPPGYLDVIDPSWGYRAEPHGLYRTTLAVDHDESGNAVRHRDALGRETAIEYDADRLFPTAATQADGARTEVTFDPRACQPMSARFPNGAAVRYRYSPLGQLLSKEELDDGSVFQVTAVYRLDVARLDTSPPAPARLTTLQPRVPGHTVDELLAGPLDRPDVDVSVEHFDSSGKRLARVTRVAAGTTRTRLVADNRRVYAGEIASADFPNRETNTFDYLPPETDEPGTRFEHDGLGRLLRATLPDGRSIQCVHGTETVLRWRLARVHDAPSRLERLNAEGLVTEVEEPPGAGVRVRTTLDSVGRTEALVNAAGEAAVRYVYAAFGPSIVIDHFQAGRRVDFLDAMGALRLRRYDDGRAMSFEYDLAGRVVRATGHGPGEADVELRRFEYENGMLAVAVDGDVTVRMTHDRSARQRSVSWSAPGIDEMTVRYEYDLQGRPTATVYPDGTRITTQRGAGGVPTSVPGVYEEVEYDVHSRMTRGTCTSGIEVLQEHDPTTHWLTRAVLSGPAGILRETRWQHDEEGEIRAIVDEAGGRSIRREFSYDDFRRLSGATTREGTAVQHVAYQFNAVDDLLAGELGPIPPDARDAAGQARALPDGTALRWDVWGRLVEARRPDGLIVRWRYDYRGNTVVRTATDANGVRTTTYAGLLYERTDQQERLNIHLETSPIACRLRHAGMERTIVSLLDPHGSPLAGVVLETAAVFQHLYTPYGLPSVLSPASTEHARWLGRAPDDDVGVVILGQRAYSPALGRFLCPDWYAIENPQRLLGAPAALNIYAYGLGNPLRYRDAGGAWFGWDDLIVAAIGFVVGAAVGAYLAHKSGRPWYEGAIEGAIIGAVGAWLGYNTGGFVFSKLGFAPGWLLGKVGISVSVSAKSLAIAGAIIGGLNGAMSGGRGIYNWHDETGYAAFIADSTWGLTGTGLGLLTNFTASGYRNDLSYRSNRQIYDGGFGFGTSAHTQGNVTTNWNNRSNANHLSEHEGLHAFQSRFFGPAYQLSYAGFLVVGGVVGLAMAPFTDQSWTKDVQDMGYYNNPWELWSYTVGGTGGKRGDLGFDPS